MASASRVVALPLPQEAGEEQDKIPELRSIDRCLPVVRLVRFWAIGEFELDMTELTLIGIEHYPAVGDCVTKVKDKPVEIVAVRIELNSPFWPACLLQVLELVLFEISVLLLLDLLERKHDEPKQGSYESGYYMHVSAHRMCRGKKVEICQGTLSDPPNGVSSVKLV